MYVWRNEAAGLRGLGQRDGVRLEKGRLLLRRKRDRYATELEFRLVSAHDFTSAGPLPYLKGPWDFAGRLF